VFSLIPLPYRIIGGLVLLAALFGGGVALGHHWATVAAEAQRVKERDAYIAQIGIQLKRADMLSAQLSQAEARVITKTVEVIKYVPKVTTGRLCLDSGAVSVLQPTSHPDVPEAPGKPPAESPPVAAASDRDVAYWIAGANQQYETCAQRLNALIDFYQ
jgi:prophage endopeptidase